MSLPNSNTWYTLYNNYTGAGSYLSLINSRGGFLQITSQTSTSTNWQFFLLSSPANTYIIRNQASGPFSNLGTIFQSGSQVPYIEVASASANSSDELWTLRQNGGSWGIKNVNLGENGYVDTYSDTLRPFLDVWDHSGDYWVFTPNGNVDDISYSTVVQVSSKILVSVSSMNWDWD